MSSRNFRQLLHLPPGYHVSGELTFMLDLIKELKEYNHTILFQKLPVFEDMDVIRILHSTGADVVFTEVITIDNLRTDFATAGAAIVYSGGGCDDMWRSGIPTLYYALSGFNLSVGSKVQLAATPLLAKQMDATIYTDVMPPGINTRALRNYQKADEMFTVGIISTQAKYPDQLIAYMLDNLPKDILLCMTTLDTYDAKSPVPAAMAKRKQGGVIYNAPLKFEAGINYLCKCDLLLHEGPPTEYYSRTVVEAMALGRPVICMPGNVADQFSDRFMIKVQTYPEMLEKILELRNDKPKYRTYADDCQLRAAWEDISLNNERFRQALRMVGV